MARPLALLMDGGSMGLAPELLASASSGSVRRTTRLRLMAGSAPSTIEAPVEESLTGTDTPWLVIVWNDPVNLMPYVVFVFQKLFGYSKEKATRLMLEVHHDGKSVVSHGTREKAEIDVVRLHAHGLWATMERDRAS